MKLAYLKNGLRAFQAICNQKLLDKELAYNVRSASRLIEQQTDEVWASLEEAVKDKLVLLNRAPTLHKLGIQAFYPKLTEGESIKLHPMVCKAFNADFDGDQMAVHLPLSDRAQKEAREIMLSSINLLKPATGTPIVTLYQDISLGCYYLTQIKEGVKGEGRTFSSEEEAILANQLGDISLQAEIKVRLSDGKMCQTSVGRIIFNESLPAELPFVNSLIKVKDLERITQGIINEYGFKKTEEFLIG